MVEFFGLGRTHPPPGKKIPNLCLKYITNRGLGMTMNITQKGLPIAFH
jgi:hypothetical protein